MIGIIRPAKTSDIPQMYDISSRAHLSSYYDTLIPADLRQEYIDFYAFSDGNRQRFSDRMLKKIDQPGWRSAVAEVDGRVAGYTIAHLEEDGTLTLKGLFVDPEMQKMGIGSGLFEHSLGWRTAGKGIVLLVISANDIAKKVYIRHGFKVVGTSEVDFFGAKQDVMKKLP